jgi:hypothetical protein
MRKISITICLLIIGHSLMAQTINRRVNMINNQSIAGGPGSITSNCVSLRQPDGTVVNQNEIKAKVVAVSRIKTINRNMHPVQANFRNSKVFATLIPKWSENSKPVRLLEPKTRNASVISNGGITTMTSYSTGGVGFNTGLSLLGINDGYEILFVWDDSGNIGLAPSWSSGLAGGSALNIQGGAVFQFTTANTIFDLIGQNLNIGASASLFGVNYVTGSNRGGTPYWGMELMLGPSFGFPPAWPAGFLSFSGSVSETSTVIDLSPSYWEFTSGMNDFFNMNSFGFP